MPEPHNRKEGEYKAQRLGRLGEVKPDHREHQLLEEHDVQQFTPRVVPVLCIIEDLTGHEAEQEVSANERMREGVLQCG